MEKEEMIRNILAGDEVDIITTPEPILEKYPEVTMEIRQVADQKPEDLVKKIETELKKDFPELWAVETVTEPVEGYLLHGLNGSDWDAEVVHSLWNSGTKKEDGQSFSFFMFIVRKNYVSRHNCAVGRV